MWPAIAILLMWQPALPTSGDALVEKARLEVGRFIVGLPNYECRQTTERYVGRSIFSRWVMRDRVSTILAYRDGRDHYRDFKINGIAATAERAVRTGSWLNGDFGNILLNVFSYGSEARFDRDREAKYAGERTAIYRFSVDARHSQWQIGVPGAVIRPAFTGKVWISLESSRVLRVELTAVGIPPDFARNSAQVRVEYRWVTLGDTRFLLPAKSEVVSCTPLPECNKNVTEFGDYRKFTTESTITFKEQ